MSRDEIIAAIKAYCVKAFSGDYRAGFDHYADPQTGNVGLNEVEELLKDADVGGMFTRRPIAELIIRELDTEGDGAVSWGEFSAAL